MVPSCRGFRRHAIQPFVAVAETDADVEMHVFNKTGRNFVALTNRRYAQLLVDWLQRKAPRTAR